MVLSRPSRGCWAKMCFSKDSRALSRLHSGAVTGLMGPMHNGPMLLQLRLLAEAEPAGSAAQAVVHTPDVRHQRLLRGKGPVAGLHRTSEGLHFEVNSLMVFQVYFPLVGFVAAGMITLEALCCSVKLHMLVIPCARGKRFRTVRAFPRIHDPNLLLPLVPSWPSRFWCPPLNGRWWWWIHLGMLLVHGHHAAGPAGPASRTFQQTGLAVFGLTRV